LVAHFFQRTRRRSRHGGNWYADLVEEITPALLCYLCTAMRHVLDEWLQNGGCRPAKNPAAPQQMRSGEYTFSPSHDTGAPPPAFSHPRRGLTRSPDVYRQLVRTWNELRPAYHDRVRDTFVVAIRDRLVVPDTTARAAPPFQATQFSEAAMDRIMAEPPPLPAVSTGPAAVEVPALRDVPSAAGTPGDMAGAVSGGEAGDSGAEAPVDEPSPAATVCYLSCHVFAIANRHFSQRSASPRSVASVPVCYLSCHVFAIAKRHFSQRSASPRSVASVPVCYLPGHVFAMADCPFSQRSASSRSVASVRVCCLSCHVLAIADRCYSAVVVPNSRRAVFGCA
jgi:hypothetical protein